MRRTALHFKLYTKTMLKLTLWISAFLYLLLQVARAS